MYHFEKCQSLGVLYSPKASSIISMSWGCLYLQKCVDTGLYTQFNWISG